jgi:hypothetical protein
MWGGFLDLDFVVEDYGLRVSANHHLIIPLSVTPHLYFTDISRRGPLIASRTKGWVTNKKKSKGKFKRAAAFRGIYIWSL